MHPICVAYLTEFQYLLETFLFEIIYYLLLEKTLAIHNLRLVCIFSNKCSFNVFGNGSTVSNSKTVAFIIRYCFVCTLRSLSPIEIYLKKKLLNTTVLTFALYIVAEY